MSLPPPVPREPIHRRLVECRGYRRADGLWDIEGHLTDTKSYPFTSEHRGRLEPGDPVHDMWLRLTVDDDLTVVDAVAVTDAGPFAICGDIAPAFAKLIGLRIGPGWRGAIRERLGGVHGCTHLVELLGPLATAAFQTIFPLKSRQAAASDDDRPPVLLDTCHAFARDGEVVRRRYPRWYTGPKDQGTP